MRKTRSDPLPVGEREREVSAARHVARWRRLYGVSETAEPEPPALPVFLSSDEVIGLLAYGRTGALDGPVPGAPPMFKRWSSHLTGGMADDRQYPLVRDIRLVLARVRWWKRRKRGPANHGACPIRPLDFIARAHMRVAIRRHGMTAVRTIALLRTDVRQSIRAVAEHNRLIGNTRAALCAEIAAGNLVALGRPGHWQKRRFTSGLPEAIPPAFFANPNNTILPDGWATGGSEGAADRNGPDWGDLRFERDEVFRLMNGMQSQPRALDEEVVPPTTAQRTVAQQTALRNWLVAEMKRAPNAPRSKDDMRKAAADAKLEFSKRAFERCWGIAIVEAENATAWSKPGRKSKRRIDTPN
jgi:hypothetical protein